MNWYIEVLKKYAVFEGRARRKEYWMFTLVNFVVSFLLSFIGGFMMSSSSSGIAGVGILVWLYLLATIIPSLAVTVRRLHDTGRSGWWLLIALVPIVGGLVLLVFALQDGQPGTNQYGPNPKEIGEAAFA